MTELTRQRTRGALVLAGLMAAIQVGVGRAAETTIDGPLRVWHPIRIDFSGPRAGEMDVDPNPFLDYRLQVDFTSPAGRVWRVPGFFAGDGEGGEAGNVWRVMFTPDQAGRWSYRVSFREGQQVAIALAADAGSAAAFDGQAGDFEVAARDPDAAGFLKWGRLEYAGGHYLKFRDGPHFLRGGTDSPENLLAYAGFDNTPPSHKFENHRRHWEPGDPDWGDGRGRALVGAINYLSSQNVNSLYALLMNIGGDGQDVWPWAGRPAPAGSADNDNLHFDLSKLEQWNIVFTHAQEKGLLLHLVFNEAEKANKQELDGGELGTERKLYYREMIARFGHHLAVQWNLCEEYNVGFDLGPQRVRDFADYIRSLDPYNHPVTVHSAHDPVRELAFTFGDDRFAMTSIQLNQRRIDEVAEAIRAATIRAGRPLPVSLDEFTIDAGQEKSWIPVDDAQRHRKEKLWPTYFSGGMIEFILEGLLEVDTFETTERAALWDYVWKARRFMQDELPFWKMEPADELVRGAATIEVGSGAGKITQLGPQVFTECGETYAVYFPDASAAGELDLSAVDGPCQLRWYDPREGSFRGGTLPLSGGSWVPLGAPPLTPQRDWVALVERIRPEPPDEIVAFPRDVWRQTSGAATAADFEKVVLSRQYFCDGIHSGDINRDGHADIVAGPFWYAGPNFDEARAFYPAVPQVPQRSPSNSMFSFVHDFSGDGWPDILVLGRVHLHAAYWYENPGREVDQLTTPWARHYAFERVRGESPALLDLDQDGRPQLVCHWENRWGWIEPHWDAPRSPWRFQPISDPGEWGQFYHGTGVGDVNGDGRLDLVINDGWFAQPSESNTAWDWHPHQFSASRGGAQMFVSDLDGDGDGDVITSLDAHEWGLAWFEQYEDNGAAFRMHKIMGTREEIDQYGVAFTQPHALDLGDISGDGLPDLVVGKRMWAHGPAGDIEPQAEPVLYWFELVRAEGEARFKPHLIDNRSGVGVQVTIADLNADGRLDVLTASKLGSFLFLNRIERRPKQ